MSMVFLTSGLEFTDGSYLINQTGNVTTVTPVYNSIQETSTIFGSITYHTVAIIQVFAAIAGFIYVFVDRREANNEEE